MTRPVALIRLSDRGNRLWGSVFIFLCFMPLLISPVRLTIETFNPHSSLGEWVGDVDITYPVPAPPGSLDNTTIAHTGGVLTLTWTRRSSIFNSVPSYATAGSVYVNSVSQTFPVSGKVLIWNGGKFPTSQLSFTPATPLPGWQSGSLDTERAGDLLTCAGYFGEVTLQGALHRGTDNDAAKIIAAGRQKK